MIDFHAHILPGVDDGIVNMDKAIYAIQEAKKAGFKKIIATSHFSPRDEFIIEEDVRKKLLKELNSKVEGIEIILGNEIFISSIMDELIKDKKASTINNSKYILFEIPLNDRCSDLKNTIIDLISKGYKLVLAHPERYATFQKNPKDLEDLIEMGVYLQANFLSILGLYGKDAKRTVELLFKHRMISFLGSDMHRTKIYYPNIEKARKQIVSIIGQAEFNNISSLNAEKVLKNEKVEMNEYIEIHKNFFGKYK